MIVHALRWRYVKVERRIDFTSERICAAVVILFVTVYVRRIRDDVYCWLVVVFSFGSKSIWRSRHAARISEVDRWLVWEHFALALWALGAPYVGISTKISLPKIFVPSFQKPKDSFLLLCIWVRYIQPHVHNSRRGNNYDKLCTNILWWVHYSSHHV